MFKKCHCPVLMYPTENGLTHKRKVDGTDLLKPPGFNGSKKYSLPIQRSIDLWGPKMARTCNGVDAERGGWGWGGGQTVMGSAPWAGACWNWITGLGRKRQTGAGSTMAAWWYVIPGEVEGSAAASWQVNLDDSSADWSGVCWDCAGVQVASFFLCVDDLPVSGGDRLCIGMVRTSIDVSPAVTMCRYATALIVACNYCNIFIVMVFVFVMLLPATYCYSYYTMSFINMYLFYL